MIKMKNFTTNKLMSEDQNLFYRISQSEYHALESLFNKYYIPLCRFGNLFEKNQMIIEEQVSDVFMLIWNQRYALGEIKNPKAYLYVIVKNHLRKQFKIKTRNQYIEETPENQLKVTSHPSIEDEVIYNEQNEENRIVLTTILNRIPKRSREIFEMSRVDGFRYKDISEIMEISPKTVENHIATAIRIISKNLP